MNFYKESLEAQLAERKMSRKKLSEEIEMGLSYINGVFSGHHDASGKFVGKLAELGFDMNAILRNEKGPLEEEIEKLNQDIADLKAQNHELLGEVGFAERQISKLLEPKMQALPRVESSP